MAKRFLKSWQVYAGGSSAAAVAGGFIAGWIERSLESIIAGAILGLILGGAVACLSTLFWVGFRYGDRRRLFHTMVKSVIGGAALLLLCRSLGWRGGQPVWLDVVLAAVVAPLIGLMNETLDQFTADEIARAESGETPAG